MRVVEVGVLLAVQVERKVELLVGLRLQGTTLAAVVRIAGLVSGRGGGGVWI